MKLDHKSTPLTAIKDIKIPDVFYRRMRSGIPQIDKMFGGEGLLPGMAFSISGGPGAGKTTLMLQICSAFAKNGYTAGYVSGEEASFMVAYTARRLNIDDVFIATDTNVDRITQMAKDVDILIVDSFQCLSVDDDKDMKAREEETYKINQIVRAAQDNETAIGVILHVTKSGQYKGSTTIPHAVDCNMNIEVDDEAENIRTVSTSKNRYGSLCDISLYFGMGGYDFDAKVIKEDDDGVLKKSKGKMTRRNTELDQILDMKEPPHITVARVCKDLNVDPQRANYLLWQLTSANKLVKYGRGADAVWKVTQIDEPVEA